MEDLIEELGLMLEDNTIPKNVKENLILH